MHGHPRLTVKQTVVGWVQASQIPGGATPTLSEQKMLALTGRVRQRLQTHQGFGLLDPPDLDRRIDPEFKAEQHARAGPGAGKETGVCFRWGYVTSSARDERRLSTTLV